MVFRTRVKESGVCLVESDLCAAVTFSSQTLFLLICCSHDLKNAYNLCGRFLSHKYCKYCNIMNKCCEMSLIEKRMMSLVCRAKHQAGYQTGQWDVLVAEWVTYLPLM